MFIPVLLGTARNGNYSTKAANFICSQIKRLGHTTELVSPGDHITNPLTERVGKEKKGGEKYRELITKADAIVIVTPEYNRGFPGELKLMLDQLYEEYRHKFVAVCGVSSGGIGGARAVELLFPVLIGVEMFPIKKVVYFSNVEDLFGQNGEIKDDSYIEKVETMIDYLVDVASKNSK